MSDSVIQETLRYIGDRVDESLGVISLLRESNSDETNMRSNYSTLLEESMQIMQVMLRSRFPFTF